MATVSHRPNVLSEVKQGRVPQTIWSYEEVGHTDEAKKELKACVDYADSETVFISPKPLRLIKRILTIAADKDSIILDSFAGTGTTGHAVLQLNSEDGGSRQAVLIEMDKEICRHTTQRRIKSAIEGYTRLSTTGNASEFAPLGGGVSYCVLHAPLFDECGNVNSVVRFADLAAYIYFAETGQPLNSSNGQKAGPQIGVSAGRAVYLLYNGILKDKTPQGGNVLTRQVLAELPPHNGPKVIYGTSCRIGEDRLRREQITFKQIPYEIKVD